jgi:SNF2 family DNA or RNA helicase
MIRREKADVADDLPAKRRFHVHLDFRPSQELKDMMNLITKQRIVISAGMKTLKQDQSAYMMKAYNITAREKLPAIFQWFTSFEFKNAFFVEQRKCLVFGFHLDLLNGIQAWLSQQGIGNILITGQTSMIDRECSFERFRMDRECRVAVLSMEVVGQGVTLVEASLVVFAEFMWTPASHQQAEDRVHRIGQEREVEIYYLHAEGSVDDRQWEALDSKLAMISEVIGGNCKSFCE